MGTGLVSRLATFRVDDGRVVTTPTLMICRPELERSLRLPIEGTVLAYLESLVPRLGAVRKVDERRLDKAKIGEKALFTGCK